MQDCWYSDNRDLVKWGVLLHLAKANKAQRILQLAYYRPSTFRQVVIDGTQNDLPAEVVSHFRNIKNVVGISPNIAITVFDEPFEDRASYHAAIMALLPTYAHERCIVFLDPDTGLAPTRPDFKHVLEGEARDIWKSMKHGDVFVFYQHKTNRNNAPWIEPKRRQLAEAIGVQCEAVRIAQGPSIANDVVFYYSKRA